MEPVVRSVRIRAPREVVWEALTRPEHVGRWFGDAGASIDLRPGGAASFSWTEHGTSRARVEEVEAPSRFAFTWWNPGEPEGAPGTLARFTLEDAGPAEGERVTVVTVVETGFEALSPDPAVGLAQRAENAQGWLAELEDLRLYAEDLAGAREDAGV